LPQTPLGQLTHRSVIPYNWYAQEPYPRLGPQTLALRASLLHASLSSAAHGTVTYYCIPTLGHCLQSTSSLTFAIFTRILPLIHNGTDLLSYYSSC